LVTVAGQAVHSAIFLLMRINFATLQLCYVVLIDWHDVFRKIRRLPPAEAPERPAILRSGSVLPSAVVGSLLVAASVLTGITHTGNGWPFSGYPEFAGTGPDTVQVVTFETLDRAGGPHAYSPEAALETWMEPERYRALTRSPFRPAAAGLVRARALALWDMFRRFASPPSDTVAVRFYQDTVVVDPDYTRNPVARELIMELSVDQR
jgi:hypothetical protein